MPDLRTNAAINQLFGYLREYIAWRIQNPKSEFESRTVELDLENISGSLILDHIKEHKLADREIVVLLISLVPHLFPNFLLEVVAEEFPSGTDLPVFGGVKGKNHRGIIPTGETVQFLIGGMDAKARLNCIELFSEEHLFHIKRILYLEDAHQGDPLMSGRVLIYPEMIHQLTTGIIPPPKLSTDFPAEHLETPLTWNDLILQDRTLEQVKELQTWLEYNPTLMEDWGMKARIKPGYRALFYGPSGTGKTLTATLLGKYTGRPVYRIDLSTVVSKYIGETEKHLSNLFDRATNKDWILFFDEADAIFGKRTNVRDAHDKYANQEVSYLLQRVESHPGLVILASNFKDNIDEAFTRRFQSITEFELPGTRERKLLWEKNLPQELQIDPKIDLEALSKKYELTGSNIINIIQYCCLQVLSANSNLLTEDILYKGIRKEFRKEDRLF